MGPREMKLTRQAVGRNILPSVKGKTPDYTPFIRANRRFEKDYKAGIASLRAARLDALKRLARGRGREKAFSKFASRIRRDLAESLGGFAPAVPAKAVLVRPAPMFDGSAHAHGPPSVRWSRRVMLREFALPEAAARGGDLSFLELRAFQGTSPRPLALVIGDAGIELSSGDNPATVATRWGHALARAGYVVAIPDVPALREVSTTFNKARILEGACALGEFVDDCERVLTAALARPGIDASRVWICGSGYGGLGALCLTALDGRIAGCVSADAPRAGDLDDYLPLIVPESNGGAVLLEIVAASAPAALALVEANASPWGGKADLQWALEPAKTSRKAAGAAASTVTRIAAKGYGNAGLDELFAWMARQNKAGLKGDDSRPARLPRRKRRDTYTSIASFTSRAAWSRRRETLRKDFRRLLGIPPKHRIHRVDEIRRDELPDCHREELDIWSTPCTGAKLLVLTPKKPRVRRGPNPTVLCIPGSGSNVATLEHEYGHEVVARGWTAAIVDSRVAIYPYHPGIRAGRVVVGQSIHDQLCVMDYLAGREDIDTKRIGAMGVSQGGTHSWMLAALDTRVAAAVPVCGVCTYRSVIEDIRDDWYDSAYLSFLDSHGIYYYVPAALRYGDQGDFIGLIVPRPLAILGAIHDNCFPERGCRDVHRDVKYLYRLHGKQKNLSFYLLDGPHSMPLGLREKAYRFFEKHL